jgi:hypothetical protein
VAIDKKRLDKSTVYAYSLVVALTAPATPAVKGDQASNHSLLSRRSIIMLLTTSILESSLLLTPMLLIMLGLAKVAYGPGE